MFRPTLSIPSMVVFLAIAACSKDKNESSEEKSQEDAPTMSTSTQGFDENMHMAHAGSQYSSLAKDLVINETQVILSSTINLDTENVVLVQTEGLTTPLGKGKSTLWITIDGIKSGNETTISWERSTNPRKHTYNAIALQTLGAGEHLIEVTAQHSGDDYVIGDGSNLIVMINPSPTSAVKSLSENSAIIDKETTDFDNPGTIPTTNILNLDVTTKGEPIVVLASGISSHIGDLGDSAGHTYGDAIWGIYAGLIHIS